MLGSVTVAQKGALNQHQPGAGGCSVGAAGGTEHRPGRSSRGRPRGSGKIGVQVAGLLGCRAGTPGLAGATLAVGNGQTDTEPKQSYSELLFGNEPYCQYLACLCGRTPNVQYYGALVLRVFLWSSPGSHCPRGSRWQLLTDQPLRARRLASAQWPAQRIHLVHLSLFRKRREP